MLKANCPNCGGEIEFKSKTTLLNVCSYCRSNVIRMDQDLAVIGEQAELQQDMSPLQIGSFGKYKKKSFQVLGRQVMKWSDGRWSEWYIMFNDGSGAWIAEAQGEFYLNFLSSDENEFDHRTPQAFTYKGSYFQEVDRKEVICEGSEGELPFKVFQGVKSVVTDYTNGEGGFATIEKVDGEILIHVGEVTTLKDLQMKNLRVFHGWGRP